jgi:MFS family permease
MAAWGTAEAIARPASFAYWPELVSADEVEAAASFEASTWSSSLIVGPVLAGVLVAAFSPGAAIAIDAATFLVSAAAIAASRPLVSRPPREEGGSTVRDIREGWRELCARPWLVITYTVTAFQSLIWFGPLMVLGPAYASVHLGGASGWAVVMACWGVGGLVGGFTALRVRASRPLVGAMIAIAAIGPAGVLWIVAPHLAVVAMASIVAGGGYFYSDAVQMAVVPQHVPDDVRSRVGAYGWLSFYSLQPIGMASAGVLAATFAPEAILAVTGMVVSLVALAAIATPAVNRLARVEPSSR